MGRKLIKLRGITDKDLYTALDHISSRIIMLGSRAIKQRGYNRAMFAAIIALYLMAMHHAGWFDGIIGYLKGLW